MIQRTRNLTTRFLFLLIFPLILHAQQPPSVQQGEILFEEEEKELGYSDIQRMAIQKLNTFVSSIGEREPSLPTFSDRELNYFSAAYLFCTVRKGNCPMILQTLFEVDLVKSVQTQQDICPNLTGLWKYWIENDMERRMELDVPIGLIDKYQRFKKQARPKFIKCKETIQAVRERSPQGAEFFRNRYGGDSPQRKEILKAIALLQALEKKKINLFTSQGLK